jgi:hypothetical protein
VGAGGGQYGKHPAKGRGSRAGAIGAVTGADLITLEVSMLTPLLQNLGCPCCLCAALRAPTASESS